MFANDLDTITTKSINVTSFIFEAIRLLHNCDKKNLLQI